MPGIIGGVIIFLIILSATNYLSDPDSDFDQHLIQQVDHGVPAEKLLPQIDNTTSNLKKHLRGHLEYAIMDKKLWGNGSLVSAEDLNYHTRSYEIGIKYASEYDSLRKQFAKREISKEEFLKEVKYLKERYNTRKPF